MDLRPLSGLGVDLRRIRNTIKYVLAQYCRSLLWLIFVTPTVIIYPLDYLPVVNQKQQQMLETIVQDVAKHCEIPIRKISFKDLWLKSRPKAAAGKSLDDFLQDVSSPPNQITIPKDLNRQVNIRLFTTFFTTLMNFALFTRENIIDGRLRTKLLVGDGSTPLEMCFTSLTPALITGKSVMALLSSREMTQCSAWKSIRTGYCRKSYALMKKELLSSFPLKMRNQIIAIQIQGISLVF